jgi:hypothetical protein
MAGRAPAMRGTADRLVARQKPDRHWIGRAETMRLHGGATSSAGSPVTAAD